MAYKLQYSDYPGAAAGPPDPARWVGPPGPIGPPGPQGPQGQPQTGGPFLPLIGGAVTGMLTASAGFAASAGATFSVGNPAVNGLAFNQNVYGATGGGSQAWFVCNVNSDTANASAAGGGGADCSLFGSNISAGAVGGRNGMYVSLTQNGATTLTPSQYYVCHAAFAEMGASAGGTSGVRAGTLFGRNTSARVKTGAGIYQLAVCGDEIDVSVQAGTSVLWKAGLNIVQWADDAVQGSQMDAAFGMNNQANGTAPGWKIGINFGGTTGWWPFRNTSTIIGTTAVMAGGPAVAANWGIDFAAVAFTGGFLRSTGFTVNGGGGVLFSSAAVATPTDLSKHICLASDGSSFGVNCSNEGPGGNLNLVSWSGGAMRWLFGGTVVGYVNAQGLNSMPIGQQTPGAGTFSVVQVQSTSGPTWTSGNTAPAATQPVGSLYSRVGGAVGATLYVSRGAGTWAAVAGV